MNDMKAKILGTKEFRKKFLNCLSESPKSVQIASPYIGKIPGFTMVEMSRFLFSRNCKSMRIITLPLESTENHLSKQEASIICAMHEGAEILIRNKIHSKVYQFTFLTGDQAAFVGSANLSLRGFQELDETVAFFRDIEDNHAVASDLERLSGDGAQPFEYRKITADCGDY